MSNTLAGSNFSQDLVAGNMKSAMKDADAKSRDLWMVPVDKLVIMNEFNVRPKNDEYYAAVRAIADSIKENGFYSHKPFAVLVIKRDGQDVIAVYDGHTRYDGLQLAISEGVQVERVPAVAAPSGTTLEDITVGLVTNNSGRQLEPMGVAVVCKRLIGYGLNNSDIAKRLGFTSAYVGGLLSLVGAPKRIRDMVSDGKVSASLAVNTLRDEGEKAVTVLEAGLNAAKEVGKTKVTKKNLVTAKKPVNTASIVKNGLVWINKNGQMDSSYELLSAITGKTVQELKKIKV
jgi:ParB family transcriptional regulator, chromosome partitioning protein